MTEEYNIQQLPEFLAIYYKRLFPYNAYYRWLSYGNVNKNYFPYREFSFTLEDDVYLRYQSFGTSDELAKEIQKRNPHKIDVGAVYTFRPKEHRTVSVFQAVEKELVFDIDMTDYDDVRYCCKEASICKKCWLFMVVAIKILDKALRDDFGFKHILWVYSGRRGIHCWVCDEAARKLTTVGRASVADYLTLVSGGENRAKKVNLPEILHPSTQRAVKIIESHFNDLQIGQDFMGTHERWKKVLNLIPDAQLSQKLDAEMAKCDNSFKRWDTVKHAIQRAASTTNSKKLNNLVDEIMLQLCYPRLDVNVTKGLNHLLKSPFCIHPKTGRVCVPIDIKNLDVFNPFSVPVVSQLVGEINKHDREMHEVLSGDTNENLHKRRVQDYKKTSLNQSIEVFKDFLKDLETTWSGKLIEKSDMQGDF